MRLSKTLAAILLCAATLTLSHPVTAAASRPSQKPRAKAQTPAPHTEITKEKIEAMVKAIHQAAKNKNVDIIAAYLAPEVKWKLEGGGRPVRFANRAQYLAILRLTMEQVLDSTFLVKSLTVTVAPDGQSATAQSEIFEMMTFAQGTVAANVVGTTTFKVHKGKILITAMESTITYV